LFFDRISQIQSGKIVIGTSAGSSASRSRRQPAISERKTCVSSNWISTSVANHHPPGQRPPGRRS
jgi:hypothetical protein